MSLSVGTIKFLLEVGLQPERLADAIEAIEADFAPDMALEARREADRVRQARYRERRRLGPAEWEELRGQVIRRDGEVCAYCKGPASPPHIDHIMPLARGGSNDLSNLCVACGPCNSAKAGRTVVEWRGRAG